MTRLNRLATFLFTPLDNQIHSWCVRAGLLVLGIGAAFVLLGWPR